MYSERKGIRGAVYGYNEGHSSRCTTEPGGVVIKENKKRVREHGENTNKKAKQRFEGKKTKIDPKGPKDVRREESQCSCGICRSGRRLLFASSGSMRVGPGRRLRQSRQKARVRRMSYDGTAHRAGWYGFSLPWPFTD